MWCLTRYVGSEDGMHIVEDIDSRKPTRVASNSIRPFPDEDLDIKRGDRLYSAWYDLDT